MEGKVNESKEIGGGETAKNGRGERWEVTAPRGAIMYCSNVDCLSSLDLIHISCGV
jgi:hypothetical protein